MDNSTKTTSNVSASISNWINVIKQKNVNRQDIKEIQNKLNLQKKDLDKTYLTLGKELYKNAKEDNKAEFSKTIDLITEKQEIITKTEKEYNKMRGVKKCDKCGALINSNYIFCGMCGAPLPCDDDENITIKSKNADDFEDELTTSDTPVEENDIEDENPEKIEAEDTEDCVEELKENDNI